MSARLLANRRQFLQRSTLGLGAAALASLLREGVLANDTTLTPPHYTPRARRVIYLFQSGAPSQMDLFDYKPKMNDIFDKDLPESIRMGQRITGMTSGQSTLPVAPSRR